MKNTIDKSKVAQEAAAILLRPYFEDLGELFFGFGFWPYEITIRIRRPEGETIVRLRPDQIKGESPSRAADYAFRQRQALLLSLRQAGILTHDNFMALKVLKYA